MNINKKQAISLAIFSLLQLTIISWWNLSTERDKLEHQVKSFKIEIDHLKGQIFLLNELVSSILEGNNKPVVLKDDRRIYSLNYPDFYLNSGKNVVNKLNEIFSLQHSWLEFSDLLYFKFLDSKTVVSSRKIKQLETGGDAIARIFSDDYCRNFYVCTKYISADNLSDGFIFSEPHVDVDTGKKTLTIVTPIFKYNQIVAESHLDVQVEKWYSVEDNFVSSIRNGEFIEIVIENKENSNDDYVWNTYIDIDNYA
ncbi:hypothetical protein, partial [Vibrio owensii]